MNIHSSTLQPLNQEVTRPSGRNARAATHADNTQAANFSPSNNPHLDPATIADQGQKTVPPGLDHVLARLQGIPASELNSGQTRALAAISRNIARYVEMQSIGNPPANPPPDTNNESGAQSIVSGATGTGDAEAVDTPV